MASLPPSASKPLQPHPLTGSPLQPQLQQKEEKPQYISIAPLLKQLASQPQSSTNTSPVSTSPSSIALAFSHIFTNRISPIQLAAFLTLLHSTALDRQPDVISLCASAMRDAASPIPREALTSILGKRKRLLSRGSYTGGLTDIVGTGGDSHSTFNISTTASIVASPLLLTAKHGNRAQSSLSGSADVLSAIQPTPPRIERVTASNLHEVYTSTNYAFLFAPNFHPGMRHAAAVRKDLGLRTILNIMGPLVNPVDDLIEARVVGVARRDLGGVFAEALRLGGAKKAMVVCGDEDLDEISCAGGTHCWWIRPEAEGASGGRVSTPSSAVVANGVRDESTTTDTNNQSTTTHHPPSTLPSTSTTYFTLHPTDFGLPPHPLSTVGGKKGPSENAEILLALLRNELPPDNPILHFVLMNVAALFVVSGVCDDDKEEGSTAPDGKAVIPGERIRETGPAGGRWKEGVRIARWCVESGRAVRELERFIEVSNRL